MKKTLFFMLVVFCSGTFAHAAEDDPLASVHKSLKDQAFVVESGDDSESESLNRISGQFDLGFSLPEQSFESSDHYRPGPFGREQAADKNQRY